MPQDKRLIVMKTVVQKIRKLSGADEDKISSQPIYLEFLVPGILLQREAEFLTRSFHTTHAVFAKNGRTSVLIVPKGIALDCSKINKRHGYFDAVVAAEVICRRGDPDAEKTAAQVALTFSHFAVDSRIVSKLPACIQSACAATTLSASSTSTFPKKVITPVLGMDEPQSLSFRMASAAKGGRVRSSHHGLCLFRVGHASMTNGELCENAKCFITALKADFPGVWKFITEFKLASPLVEKIRFMELKISPND